MSNDLDFFKTQLDRYAEKAGVTNEKAKIIFVNEKQYEALCKIYKVDKLPDWIQKSEKLT